MNFPVPVPTPSDVRDGRQRTLKRATWLLRQEGISSLWFRILARAVYRRVMVVQRLLDEPIPKITARLPIEISLLQESELDEYIDFRPEADPLDIRQRLKAQQRCFVARYEGRIVHAGWATTGQARIDYLSRAIWLALKEVYQYESFTLPEFRGHDIAPARIAHMLRYFRGAGYQRLIAVVVPENRVAFRPLEKNGYRRVGIIGYVKIGPWRYEFCRMDADCLHLVHRPQNRV